MFGAEPLKGPEFAHTTWLQKSEGTENSTASAKNEKKISTIRHRRLTSDLPIPLALWVAMPFVSLKLEDFFVAGRYLVDQSVGLGLLHHAAEGDPAWRVEFYRVGAWTTRPVTRSRALFNLVKYFPAFRLRPSDTTFSWLGLNSLTLSNGKTIFIPELAWTRDGPDGLSVDLNLPQHFFLGYKGPTLGMLLGVEQHLRMLQETIGRNALDCFISRHARFKLIINIQTENAGTFSLGASLLQELESMSLSSDDKPLIPSKHSLGGELSLRWTPNT